MKSAITIGQALIVAVTGMGPLVYYALSDSTFAENRKYKVQMEFKALQKGKGDGKARYQGMPIERICMGENRTFESAYDLQFNASGTEIEAHGRGVRYGISIKEPFEVIEKQIYITGGKTIEKGTKEPWRLNSEIKENLRLVIYKDAEEDFGILLVGSASDMWFKEYGKDNLKNEIDNSRFDQFGERIKTGKFAVRRSVKGVWSKLIDNSVCDKKQLREGEPIYKNYGVLVEEWNDSKKNNTAKDKYAEGIFENIVILDWVDFGTNKVTYEKGDWVNSDRTNQARPTIGRWDYWRLKNSNKPLEVIVGKLSDIEIDSEGIKNGRGGKITWSEKFKPTIAATLEK